MKVKISSWVPFQGFYESIYLNEDTGNSELEYFKEECANYNITGVQAQAVIDDMFLSSEHDSNIEDYKQEVAKAHCNFLIEELLESDSLQLEIDNIKIISPREYNFATDSINADITIDLDEVLKLLENSDGGWETYCKEQYTSCSGFISHYTPDQMVNGTQEDIVSDSHILGAILDYLIGDFEDIEYKVLEEVHLSYNWEQIVKEVAR